MEVNGFENYLIYPSGKVYSKKSKRYLNPYCNSHGYLNVNLYKDGKKKIYKIHRLVGLYYIPNPDNKICLDHIDRNRKNNKLNNLRWATYSENNQNTGVRKDNTSGIKNISYHKTNDRYDYRKMIRSVKHHKVFRTLEEAIQYKTIFENNI